MKKYKISLITLIIAIVAAISAFSFTVFASADEEVNYRSVTLDGTNVFYTAVNGAEVGSVQTGTETSVSGQTPVYHAMFSIGADETVTYRKNLAYNWFYRDAELGVLNGKFSITLGFENTAFEAFKIRFQSQQYSKSEDAVTSNYLVFTPNADGTVNLYVSETGDYEEVSDIAANANGCVENIPAADHAQIKVSFGDFNGGNYEIIVNADGITDARAGSFINVSPNCAKYVSSGTSAAMPLTFSANFADDAEDDSVAKMSLYQMNGQSFRVYGVTTDGENLSSGSVRDDCAPVVCMNSNTAYFNFGGTVNPDYTVIDVIASSPSATVYYYVLSYEQFENGTTAADFEKLYTSGDENNIFTSTSGKTVKLLRDKNTFIPSEYVDSDKGIIEIDGVKTYGLVKVYLNVKDVTGTRKQTDDVFLDWYADDGYLYDISTLKADCESVKFFKVIEDSRGASYAGAGVTTLAEYEERIAAIEADYQSKIDAAIAELEGGKLYAGSSNYFYLPEFSGFSEGFTYKGFTYNGRSYTGSYFGDNFDGYTDVKYSLYYKTGTTGSSTSLKSNQLAINLTSYEHPYTFTVYVTDSSGNDMYYYDESGELQTISTTQIWDKDTASLLPFFEFSVYYKEPTVEKPGAQSIGVVGTSYAGVSGSFVIKDGLSGSYSQAYTLFTFDRDRFYSDYGMAMSYEEFIENIDKLYSNTYFSAESGKDVNTVKYFTRITAASDLKESDENYNAFKDYAWNASSATFVPQSAAEFYVVRLTVSCNNSGNTSSTFMGIRVSEKANPLEGENDWLEKNATSVVLFCIAGVCFIALIALLIIKPKDKGDIDAIDLDGEKKSKAKKSGKGRDSELN